MDNFVFNVPIAAHNPYEQNLSDYDEYFLRDLDAIFGSCHQENGEYQEHSTPLSSVIPQQRTLQTEHQTWTDDTYLNSDDAHQAHLPDYSYHTIEQHKPVICEQMHIPTAHPTTTSNAFVVSVVLQTDNRIAPEPIRINPADSAVVELNPTSTNYTCTKCSKSFASTRALNCHSVRSTACRTASSNVTTAHRCDHCAGSFPTRRSLLKHLKDEHNSESERFHNARNQHRRSAHSGSSQPSNKDDTPRRSLPCDQCPRTFAYRTLLNHHRVTEHVPQPRYPCQIGFCDQVFRTAALLKRHEQLGHTVGTASTATAAGRTPADADAAVAATAAVKSDTCVRCPHAGCALAFANVVLLRRHQTLHRLRTYRCAPCARDYHSRAVFETHVRLSHPAAAAAADVVLVADEDMDSGPMECGACGQLFENRRVLRQHRQFCEDEEDAATAASTAAEAHRAAERRVLLTGKPMAIEEVYVKQEPLAELDEMVMEE